MSEVLPQVKLADLVKLNPKLRNSLGLDDLVSFIPMASIDAETGTTSTSHVRKYSEVSKGYTPFEDGDILVAKITPCFENGKLAQAKISYRIGFGSTEFHVLRPKTDELDSRYLLHYLRQERVRRDGERKMTGSAGQRRVPLNFFESLEVPIPSLVEQRQIANSLDRVEALRVKRRKALVRLDELVQSVFLDMFGETEPCGGISTTVAGVAHADKGSIRTGPFGSQLLHSEFVDSGVAVLGIDNVVTNEFRWVDRRYVTETKYRELNRYTVRSGDVLITIMGTCGRCAVAPEDIPLAINTKHLCCITLDQERCLPVFLHTYFLRHPVARRYLNQTAKGAIMSGLNMGTIKAMPLLLPPLSFQQKFVNLVESVEGLKVSHRAHLAELDALFASLQYRAFRGEL